MNLMKKEIFFLIVLLMIGGTLAPNQAVAQEDSPPANLYGTVVADSTMEPLADVEVRIQGLDKAATTDEQGRFMFDMLEPGNYTVVVRVPGFRPWSEEVEVTNEGVELQIVLKKEEEMQNQ